MIRSGAQAKTNFLLIQVVITTLLIGTGNLSFAQFINGDFQTTPAYGCNPGIGWNSSVGLGIEPESTDIFYPGNWWVDLTPCGASGNGSWIEQTISTIPNQCYTITFDLGCLYGWDVSDAGVYINIDGVSLGDRIVSNNFSLEPSTIGWSTLTSPSFVATGTSTTVRFTGEGHCTEYSVETGAYACGPIGALGNPGVIAIDNIILNNSNEVMDFSSFTEVELCPGTVLSIGGAAGGFSYLWSTGENTATIEVDYSGEFYVEYTGVCINGIDTVLVVPADIPLLNTLGADTVLCTPFEFSLPAQEIEVLWSTGIFGYSILVSDPGVYWFVNENECGSISDSISISFEEDISFNLPDVEICNGQSVQIGQAIDGVSYLWSNSSTNPTIVVQETGDYFFQYQSACAEGEEMIHVEVNYPPPPIELGPDALVCPPVFFPMPEQSVSVDWSTGENSNAIVALEAGAYWATNQNNCGFVVDSILLSEFPVISYSLPEVYDICDGESLVLSVPEEIVIYEWSTSTTEPFAEFTDGGEYFLSFFDGCNDKVLPFSIELEDCDCHVFIPNIFSANGDGLNDVWETAISDNCEFNMTVWNRWGQKIFEAESNKKFWTGEVNDGGYFAPDGVYTYILHYSSKPTVWREKVGIVTLVR